MLQLFRQTNFLSTKVSKYFVIVKHEIKPNTMFSRKRKEKSFQYRTVKRNIIIFCLNVFIFSFIQWFNEEEIEKREKKIRKKRNHRDSDGETKKNTKQKFDVSSSNHRIRSLIWESIMKKVQRETSAIKYNKVSG